MVSWDMYTLLVAQETVATCNVGAWRCFAQTQAGIKAYTCKDKGYSILSINSWEHNTDQANMLDPTHTWSRPAWKHWPEQGPMILAHPHTRRVRPKPDQAIQIGSRLVLHNMIWAFFGRAGPNQMQEVRSSIYDPAQFWLYASKPIWIRWSDLNQIQHVCWGCIHKQTCMGSSAEDPVSCYLVPAMRMLQHFQRNCTSTTEWQLPYDSQCRQPKGAGCVQ